MTLLTGPLSKIFKTEWAQPSTKEPRARLFAYVTFIQVSATSQLTMREHLCDGGLISELLPAVCFGCCLGAEESGILTSLTLSFPWVPASCFLLSLSLSPHIVKYWLGTYGLCIADHPAWTNPNAWHPALQPSGNEVLPNPMGTNGLKNLWLWDVMGQYRQYPPCWTPN